MALFGFGKRPKHRSFDYVPRFYDPEKEAFEARMSKYKNYDPNSTDAMKTRIKGSFRKPITKSYETDNYKAALRKSRRIVLFVALTLILMVIYFLMEYFPKFVQGF